MSTPAIGSAVPSVRRVGERYLSSGVEVALKDAKRPSPPPLRFGCGRIATSSAWENPRAALAVMQDVRRSVKQQHGLASVPGREEENLAAVGMGRSDDWIDVFVAVFNMGFLRLLIIFAGLQVAVGALMWLLERKHNPHFQGSHATGVYAGLWWAVVTMATVGYPQSSSRGRRRCGHRHTAP